MLDLMAADPAALHRRFVDEVVVGKRVECLDALFAAHAVLEQGSLDDLRAQMVGQAGLDLAVSYLHEFVDGDWAVHHMDIEITHVGEFMGHAGSGRVARLSEVEAVRVVDDRIVEMWSVADRMGVLLQLGLPLPPG